MKRLAGPIAVGLLLLATACATPTSHSPAAPGEKLATIPSTTAPSTGYRETGTSSWRGREFQGRTTASGEVFDMNVPSAAHRTLPLGTIIHVTNLDNSRSITVKVTDRGPFVRGRALELSYAAARELGFIAQGTAQLRIETGDTVPEGGTFSVQVAVYTEEENARMLKERLSRKYETIAIIPFESNVGRFYRVRVGAYSSQEKAERIAGKLVMDGLEPLVVRKD